ncbi:uncharacterized protein LOC121756202 [Salvia splendens]|uniref:uncharacterized protein LOC121756202 n=1 Tax=Salvia splendens TaxID=180675 RepID=UPI001C27ECA6|nr:uncharacterized protein LOC121756202 [Salvia splendens]
MAEPRRAKSALRVNGGSRVGWNGMPHSSPVTADRTRRCWADREERYLLATLKELVSHGWKSDNGFRWGYLFKLEEAMRREFPTCGLRANPHIQSKIHTWKKNYGAVAQLLDKSGVGFNINGDNNIDCDEYVWAEIIKADPSARGDT